MALKKKPVKKLKTKKIKVTSHKPKAPKTVKKVKTLKVKVNLTEKKSLIDTKTKKNKSVKTHLSAKDLNYFKVRIIDQKNEILENARRLRESLIDVNTGEYIGENTTFSMHMAEHGTDEMEREKAFMLIQRDEKHLFYLENALERIKKKTYGLCITCGKPIDKLRLETVPITQHCIKCKTSLSGTN
jgi:DnaK suppressor protein